VSCVLGPRCPCEGRERPDWPMSDSPASFFPAPIPIRRAYPEPDRWMEENLRMAWLGVE
jgi:hypothetical protein